MTLTPPKLKRTYTVQLKAAEIAAIKGELTGRIEHLADCLRRTDDREEKTYFKKALNAAENLYDKLELAAPEIGEDYGVSP